MDKEYKNQFLQVLWPSSGDMKPDSVYSVLDAGADPSILPMIQQCGLFFECLFAGNLPQELAAAAPYVVKLKKDADFTHQLIDAGWSKNWGIFLTAPPGTGIKDIRKHLRKCLLVRGPEDQKLFFRYYDPRIMRTYLPTCDQKDRDFLFDPIIKFVMEGSSGNEILEFSTDGCVSY